MLVEGPFTVEVIHVKASSEPKFSVLSKIGRKFPFLKKWGQNVKIVFGTTKRHTFAREATLFDVLSVEIGPTVLAVVTRKNPSTPKIKSSRVNIW